MIKRTVQPIQAGEAENILPEFARTHTVTRLYGLKRGTLYNLLAAGKIKGVVLRVMGDKSGVRLWHLQSIRELIISAMDNQKEAA